MGGIATNYHGEALTKKNGNDDHIVPGLMALGEAACVSVHGANRQGSNSLIDLVVFGRTGGPNALRRHAPLRRQAARAAEGPAERALSRLDKTRNASGKTPTAQLRLKMQKVMQSNCAVFRTGEVLEEGHKLIHEVLGGVTDIKVTDRSLIWNSDLVEVLEFDNLIAQAIVTMDRRATGPKAAARTRARISPTATARNWMKHTLAGSTPRAT